MVWINQSNTGVDASSPAAAHIRGTFRGDHRCSCERVVLCKGAQVLISDHHIVEDEVDGQEGQDDKREDGQQREESGVVEESQNKHMSAWR